MPAYATCVSMALLCNAIIWYPLFRWTKEFSIRWSFAKKNANSSFKMSMALYGFAGTFFVSAALSLILMSTYGSDQYLDIVATHCGADTINTLGSLSAMFGEKPNMIFWRLGMMGAMPVIIGISVLLFLRQKQSGSPLPLATFIASSLENASLAVLTAVSSRENHGLHVSATACWFASSMTYVTLSSINSSQRNRLQSSFYDRVCDDASTDDLLVTAAAGNVGELRQGDALRHRLWLQVATLHIAAGVAAIVAYVVHNAYCWSYAYSTFGAAELVVVASSVALRFIGGLELRGVRLTVSS